MSPYNAGDVKDSSCTSGTYGTDPIVSTCCAYVGSTSGASQNMLTSEVMTAGTTRFPNMHVGVARGQEAKLPPLILTFVPPDKDPVEGDVSVMKGGREYWNVSPRSVWLFCPLME